MRRRVLLLFPQLNNLVFFGVYEPLVLEIFSAIAKEEQCDVELIDLRLDPHGCERLARTGYVPDIIGLTTHGFPEVPIVNGIAALCKKLWPGSALVLGGGQATVSPEMFNQRHVDLLVRGPGEKIWRDLCRKGVASGPCRISRSTDHGQVPQALRHLHSAPHRSAMGARRAHRLHPIDAGMSLSLQLLRDLAGESRAVSKAAHSGDRRGSPKHGRRLRVSR